MRERYVVKDGRRLRSGYTTGSCAAAACHAAAAALLGGNLMQEVSIHLPDGSQLTLNVEQLRAEAGYAFCAVRKDAGDDPDVTDGMLICATVEKTPAGIEIDGGEGVGRATRNLPGLSAGEAAINPVPRRMIRAALLEVCEKCAYAGGLRAVISVPGGMEAARKTHNPRLGIEDGISILGTTGIVEPMSDRAILDTIRMEIDLRRSEGKDALLLVPGNYGLQYVRDAYSLEPEIAVKCSNFIGEALDYARYAGFRRIFLAGHAGKLIRLAAGIMNTHSRVADGRMEILTAHAALAGLMTAQIRMLFQCVTVEEADSLLVDFKAEKHVWDSIAGQAEYHLRYRMGEDCSVAFAAFLKRGEVMRSVQTGAGWHF